MIDFFESCIENGKSIHSIDYVLEWIAKRNEDVDVEINQIAFGDLDKWKEDPASGNIFHETGMFFSVEGVEITAETGQTKSWSQPILNQPEVGYLGFIVKKINGILHFLVQAKIEPGNVNFVQLSPTIQATRSNYMRVHKGKTPAYLEYFKNPKGNLLIDQLQSEQGARFYRKRNRNMIIEVDENMPVLDDFIWLTLGQIKELLKYDNVVNMDTRTVISGIGYGSYDLNTIHVLDLFASVTMAPFQKEIYLSYINSSQSLHSINTIHSWITELKSSYSLKVNLIPLNQVNCWSRDNYSIYHEDHRYFRVIAVDVAISNREVTKWSQPVVEPCQEGLVGFISKSIDGVLHFLVQAKLEVGNIDIIELAPTVQCITGNYRKGLNEYEVPYLDYILNARSEQIKYDVLLSEEGGRFYKNQNRNIIVLADDNFEESEMDNYRWLTLNQIMHFMRFNNYFNIEARSLISVLSFK